MSCDLFSGGNCPAADWKRLFKFGDSIFHFILEAYALSRYARNMKLLLFVCSSTTTVVTYEKEKIVAFQLLEIDFFT